MRPVQDKLTLHFKKDGFKRIIGLASAWAAHKARKCVEGCFYCGQIRRVK